MLYDHYLQIDDPDAWTRVYALHGHVEELLAPEAHKLHSGGRVLWRASPIGAATCLRIRAPVNLANAGREVATQFHGDVEITGRIFAAALPGTSGNKRRVSLPVRLDQLPAWLGQRGRTNGYSLRTLAHARADRYQIEKGGANFTVVGYEIAAHVIVRDPALFALMLSHGLGRQRAFGFGLIDARPI
jgi:hypothetical protein